MHRVHQGKSRLHRHALCRTAVQGEKGVDIFRKEPNARATRPKRLNVLYMTVLVTRIHAIALFEDMKLARISQ